MKPAASTARTMSSMPALFMRALLSLVARKLAYRLADTLGAVAVVALYKVDETFAGLLELGHLHVAHEPALVDEQRAAYEASTSSMRWVESMTVSFGSMMPSRTL